MTSVEHKRRVPQVNLDLIHLARHERRGSEWTEAVPLRRVLGRV
jgi:hypothetical protein